MWRGALGIGTPAAALKAFISPSEPLSTPSAPAQPSPMVDDSMIANDEVVAAANAAEAAQAASDAATAAVTAAATSMDAAANADALMDAAAGSGDASDAANADAEPFPSAPVDDPMPNAALQASLEARRQLEAAVRQMLADGERCFADQQYSCALTNAANVLRLKPDDSAATRLKARTESAQTDAMDSIDIQ